MPIMQLVLFLEQDGANFFIRAMVAHDISALMEYKGLTLQEVLQRSHSEKTKRTWW